MKLIGLTAVTALAFAGCQKQQEIARTDEAPPEAKSAPATPMPATPSPTTPAAELAPPGIFYLLTPARVATDDGIQTLPTGTGVKLVRAGVYLTPVGEAPLDAAQLTNDMALARQARDADRARQAGAQASGAERVNASAPPQASAAPPASQVEAPVTSHPMAPAPPKPAAPRLMGTSLDRPNTGLEKPYNSTKDKTYTDERGRVYWRDIYGRRHYD